MAAPLQPGELTKPVRVWCTSTSIRIAWYQAEPISEQVTVFYKKSGSLFGTEIVLPTASLRGPDLSMRPPAVTQGRAEYYELDIRKLRPNTQYIVKVRATGSAVVGQTTSGGGAAAATDDLQDAAASPPELSPFPSGPPVGPLPVAAVASSVRSDRLSTLGVQEEIKRNLDMGNFVGSLIKLGEYDGTITAFEPATGLYEVRILQEEASSTPQLVRLASEYSDLGLPARTYTLSSIKFGRWGGEISSSQVVGEGEMRWIVGRAVQLAERSEAANTFALREEALHARNSQLSAQLDAQREAALASLALTRRTYKVLCGALLLLSILLVSWSWMMAVRASGTAHHKVDEANRHVTRLRQQLRQLELYREAMELDAAAWMSKAASKGADGFVRPGGGAATPFMQQQQRSPHSNLTESVCIDSPDGVSICTTDGIPDFAHGSRDHCVNASDAAAGSTQRGAHAQYPDVDSHPHHPLLDMDGPLLDALRRQPGSNRGSRGGSQHPWADGSTDETQQQQQAGKEWGERDKEQEAAGDGATSWQQASNWDLSELDLGNDPPQPWLYVQHAATLYSLYVNEWVKQQMARSIRGHIQDLLAAQKAESTGPASADNVTDDVAAEEVAVRPGHDSSDDKAIKQHGLKQQVTGKTGKGKRGGSWSHWWSSLQGPRWLRGSHNDQPEVVEQYDMDVTGSRRVVDPSKQQRRQAAADVRRARAALPNEPESERVVPGRQRRVQEPVGDVRGDSMSQGRRVRVARQAHSNSHVRRVGDESSHVLEQARRLRRRLPQQEEDEGFEYDYAYDYVY